MKMTGIITTKSSVLKACWIVILAALLRNNAYANNTESDLDSNNNNQELVILDAPKQRTGQLEGDNIKETAQFNTFNRIRIKQPLPRKRVSIQRRVSVVKPSLTRTDNDDIDGDETNGFAPPTSVGIPPRLKPSVSRTTIASRKKIPLRRFVML